MKEVKTKMYRSKTEEVFAFSVALITIVSIITGMVLFILQ